MNVRVFSYCVHDDVHRPSRYNSHGRVHRTMHDILKVFTTRSSKGSFPPREGQALLLGVPAPAWPRRLMRILHVHYGLQNAKGYKNVPPEGTGAIDVSRDKLARPYGPWSCVALVSLDAPCDRRNTLPSTVLCIRITSFSNSNCRSRSRSSFLFLFNPSFCSRHDSYTKKSSMSESSCATLSSGDG